MKIDPLKPAKPPGSKWKLKVAVLIAPEDCIPPKPTNGKAHPKP